MESRFVNAAGLRMHYLEHGSGQPVIAIHGWPETCHEWRRVAPLLGPDHRVLAPDTRGHGRTEAPPHGYDRAQLAGDIVAFMDALGIDRCPVVAHDWGGIIVVKLALDHGGGHFFAEARPEETAARLRAFLVHQAHGWA